MTKQYIETNSANVPDARGYYGEFGGRFVPETIIPALDELEAAYHEAMNDPAFQQELMHLNQTYTGRPTPVTYAKRLTEHLGGAQIYLKREDLAHTGAHKINNALGQALLAKRMGKTRVIAETGAGQHGVASVTACSMLGLDCIVYMGEVDMERQKPNVFRMRLMGGEVRAVSSGSRTLKDAINDAMRDWVTNVRDTFYMLGSALGPHPYPMMVRDFQSVIGLEAREQIQVMAGRLPDTIVACVGGGSNAIGMFHAFRDDEDIELIGVEAGGMGTDTIKHASRFNDPSISKPGILHGTRSYVMQNGDGQIMETYSISAGLDYPSVGPEHAYLRSLERAFYTDATDAETMQALKLLSEMEGIIPALESAHAVAEVLKRAPKMSKDQVILVNLSGRGDKDLDTIFRELSNEVE
ncbi:MAG: tryptophan synthase subunit beta [Phototrophicaceae bacterium]